MRSPRGRRLAGGLAIVGAIGLAAIGLSGDRGPRSAADDGGPRLAIVDADGQLTITDRAGAELRRFPTEGPAIRFPTFSPDGRRIAAIGTDGAQAGVYVYDATGAGVAGAAPTLAFESTETGLIYLSWSPQGDRLSVLSSEPTTLALRLLAPDDRGPGTIVHEGQPLYWDWSADGTLFVHSGGTGPRSFLDEVDRAGATRGLGLEPAGLFQAPGLSRDGRFRAYAAVRPGGGQVLRIESREQADATELDVGAAVAFSWSPDSRAVAFVDGGGAAGTGLGPLRIVDPATAADRVVLDRPVAAWFWSPDARFLAALVLGVRADDSVASTAVAATPPLELHAVIVEAATGSIRSDRAIRPSELFLRQFVPFFDQYAKSHPIWAPDSSAIALPLSDDDEGPPLSGDDRRSRITVIPVDDAPVVDIGPGVLAFWSP